MLSRRDVLVALPAAAAGAPYLAVRPGRADPGARRGHVMAYCGSLGSVVVLGGYLTPVPAFEAAWSWNGARWTRWGQSGPVPQARTMSALASDTARGRLVLFGGMSGVHQSRYGDVWEWSDGVWADQSAPSGPGPRDHHACAYDAAREEVVVYGGQDSERHWDRDTWIWSSRQWRRVEGANPGERAHHALAYDSGRKRVVLHGGFGATGGNRGDTWEWDGNASCFWRWCVARDLGSRHLGVGWRELV